MSELLENGAAEVHAGDGVLDPSAPSTVPGGLAYDELVESAAAGAGRDGDLSLVFDLPVELAVEIGRTTMTIRETLAIAPGSMIQLNRLAGEPVDLLVNGHRIARGEVVAIDEEFGLRVTEIVTPQADRKEAG